MKKILFALKAIALPLLVCLLAVLVLKDDIRLYNVLILPPFSLPGHLFFGTWAALYLLMGISDLLFQKADVAQEVKRNGKLLYRTQLVLHFIWQVCFFKADTPLISFFLLIGLFLFASATEATFLKASKISGILLIPHLLYLLYAGYLNIAIWFLNM